MNKLDVPGGPDKPEKEQGIAEWGKKWLENPGEARTQHEAVRGGYGAFQQYYQSIPDVSEKAKIALKLFEPARTEIETYLKSRDERKKDRTDLMGIPDRKREFVTLMNTLDRLVPYGFPTTWFIWDIEKAHDLITDEPR